MDQGNRIDNRARGNAAQLLEKYKKMAHDAQMNGDRVNTEYYLQFADHYFRVLADNKARQDEYRRPREDNRDFDRDYRDDGDDEDEGQYGVESTERDTRAAAQQDQPRQDNGRGQQAERGERDGDDGRGRRGRRPGRPPRQAADDSGSEGGLDPSSLPPAIGAGREDGAAEDEAPRPKRRAPRRKADEGVAVEG